MNKKGQAAFESLIILLVILTVTIMLSSHYLVTHEDTIALSTARNAVLEQINEKQEEITIKQITLKKTNIDTNLDIELTPATDLNKEKIRTKVLERVSYDPVKLKINIQ